MKMKKPKKKPKTKKPSKKIIFVVDSYCDDQWESFLDLVTAFDEEEAKAMVAEVRDYAVVTYATTLRDYVANAKRLGKGSNKKVEREWEALMKEQGQAKCPQCDHVMPEEETLCEACELAQDEEEDDAQ